jgi:hypothetical protein
MVTSWFVMVVYGLSFSVRLQTSTEPGFEPVEYVKLHFMREQGAGVVGTIGLDLGKRRTDGGFGDFAGNEGIKAFGVLIAQCLEQFRRHIGSALWGLFQIGQFNKDVFIPVPNGFVSCFLYYCLLWVRFFYQALGKILRHP